MKQERYKGVGEATEQLWNAFVALYAERRGANHGCDGRFLNCAIPTA